MALRKFYTSYQSIPSSCDEYFKKMSNLRDVISHCVGVIVNHPFLVEKFLKAADPADPDNPTKKRRTQPRLNRRGLYGHGVPTRPE